MRHNRVLWTIQVLLSSLFLLAGSMKLVLPIKETSGAIGLPGPFLRFIGVAEVCGALGLVLPWLLGIRPALTPIAAGGLLVIMIGAVIVTAAAGGAAGVVVPAIVGAALTTVVYGRMQALAV